MEKIKIFKTTDYVQWIEKLHAIKNKHIVHYPQYMRVFEKYEDAIGECFVFESDLGTVIYPYLRRSIPHAGLYTDMVTPYGYGGPILEAESSNQLELAGQFCRAFNAFAIDTKTVSQFIRFHPVLQNHIPFVDFWDEVKVQCRNALIMLDPRNESVESLPFRSEFRSCIKQARAKGLKLSELVDEEWVVDFYNLYSESMDRKNGSGYYRFNMEFIRHLKKELGSNVRCFSVKHEKELCAIAIFLSYSEHLEYFLAASNPLTLSMRPNHLMINDMCAWSLDNKVSKFHLGGGSDTLLFFKMGFANVCVDYYVGRIIFDNNIYRELTNSHFDKNQRHLTNDESWFPAYRKEFFG